MSKEGFAPKEGVEAAFGAPPDHAPRETAQPVADATLQAQLDMARRNERQLAPLAPPGDPNAAQIALAEAARAHAESARSDRPEPGQQYQPAASNSDSPARGVPRPIADPNLRPMGGFGDAMSAQYNPLNGLELAELCRHLMGELSTRIANDLRFHIGIVYPRLTARVVIEVAGYADAAGFEVAQVAVHDKTPVEVARQHADEIAFAVIAQRQEFDDEGTPENPPDRIRDELGVPKPAKQWVGSGPNRDLVDIVPGPGDLF